MSALGTGPNATVPYFRAKWAAEQAVGGSGIDHVVLRPSFVFGSDGGALPRFVRIARLFPLTPVIGPGTQRLQPIWIDDVVRAVRLAVDGEGSNGPVELGGPDPVTWSDFWRRLKSALGTRRPSIHVPFWLARGPAAMFERIPPALLTLDQLRMLEGPDNVVSDGGAVDGAARPRRAVRARRAAPPRGLELTGHAGVVRFRTPPQAAVHFRDVPLARRSRANGCLRRPFGASRMDARRQKNARAAPIRAALAHSVADVVLVEALPARPEVVGGAKRESPTRGYGDSP